MNETISEALLCQRQANWFFALADPTRVHILHVLEREPHSVNQLASELGIPQPMTSRHLRILRERGMVCSTRHGVSVTYSLSDPRLAQTMESLSEICSQIEERFPTED